MEAMHNSEMSEAVELAKSYLYNVLHAEYVDRLDAGTEDFTPAEEAWVRAFREQVGLRGCA